MKYIMTKTNSKLKLIEHTIRISDVELHKLLEALINRRLSLNITRTSKLEIEIADIFNKPEEVKDEK